MQTIQTAKDSSQIVVIGIGNEYRHDDAAGLLVARRLKERAGGSIKVLEEDGEVTRLMEAWRDAGVAIVCDAISTGSEPGTVYRFELASLPIPGNLFRYSTHAFTLADTIEMARVLGQLPARMIVYGINGADFTPGEGVSPEVDQAIEHVVQSVLAFADGYAATLLS